MDRLPNPDLIDAERARLVVGQTQLWTGVIEDNLLASMLCLLPYFK